MYDSTLATDDDTDTINTTVDETLDDSSFDTTLGDEALTRMLQRAEWTTRRGRRRAAGTPPTINGRNCEDMIALRSANKIQRERWDKSCLSSIFDRCLSEINRSIDNCIQDTGTTLTGSNGLILYYRNFSYNWPSFSTLHTTSHTASMVLIWLFIKYNSVFDYTRLFGFVQENCDPAHVTKFLSKRTRTHDDGVTKFIEIDDEDKSNISSHMTMISDAPETFLKGPLQSTYITHMCISQLSRHNEVEFQHTLNILEPWWKDESMVYNDNTAFTHVVPGDQAIKPERVMFFRHLQRLRDDAETAGVYVGARRVV